MAFGGSSIKEFAGPAALLAVTSVCGYSSASTLVGGFIALAALGPAAPLVVGTVAVGAALAPNLFIEWMTKKSAEREDQLQVKHNDVISRMLAKVLADTIETLSFDPTNESSDANQSIQRTWIKQLTSASMPSPEGARLRRQLFQYDQAQQQRDQITQLFAQAGDTAQMQERLWSMIWPVLTEWAGAQLPEHSNSLASDVLKARFFDGFHEVVYKELSKKDNTQLRTKLAMNAQNLSLQLSFSHQQLAQQIIDDLESLRDALLQPSLEFPIYQLASDPEQRLVVSSLKYTLRLVDHLAGPADAWNSLQDFALHTAPFRWAILTGPAGAGKSRLALELGLWLRQSGWQVGFLKGEIPSNLNLVQKPLLLIVDYCAAKASSLHVLLRRLSQRTGGNPVRILLLERYFHADAQWARELIAQDYGIIHTWSGEQIAVPALEPDEMLSVFRRAYRALTDDEPVDGLAVRAKTIFDEDRFSRRLRPIYATAAALIAARNPDTFLQLHGDHLIDTILQEEELFWRQRNASESDAHAIFVSTWSGQNGAGFDRIRYSLSCLQAHRRRDNPHFQCPEPDFNRAMQLVGVEDERQGLLAPIEPDLIGEHYLAMRLSGDFRCGGTAFDVRIASEHLLRCLLHEQECDEAVLGLAIQDFIHRKDFRDVLLKDDVLRTLPTSALSKLAVFSSRAGKDMLTVLARLDDIGFQGYSAWYVARDIHYLQTHSRISVLDEAKNQQLSSIDSSIDAAVSAYGAFPTFLLGELRDSWDALWSLGFLPAANIAVARVELKLLRILEDTLRREGRKMGSNGCYARTVQISQQFPSLSLPLPKFFKGTRGSFLETIDDTVGFRINPRSLSLDSTSLLRGQRDDSV